MNSVVFKLRFKLLVSLLPPNLLCEGGNMVLILCPLASFRSIRGSTTGPEGKKYLLFKFFSSKTLSTISEFQSCESCSWAEWNRNNSELGQINDWNKVPGVRIVTEVVEGAVEKIGCLFQLPSGGIEESCCDVFCEPFLKNFSFLGYQKVSHPSHGVIVSNLLLSNHFEWSPKL